MASKVQIANRALGKVGAKIVVSLDDTTVKEARTVNAAFDIVRDAAIRAHNWSFAMERASLSALTDTPAWGYNYLYQLPTDCLRVVQVNDAWVAVGLTDYIGGPDAEPYKITGRRIETDYAAPLKLRYLKRIEDTSQWDACFVEYFACRLAYEMCETLTQSNTKKESLRGDMRQHITEAIRANAIELPPTPLPDDSWVLGRL